MKDFTVKEIVEFSQRVEQESYDYYKSAQTRLSDQEVIDLTEELAQAEIDHFNRLRALVSETKLTEAELKEKISIEADTYEKCVAKSEIPPDPSSRDVLNVALEREKNTRNLYQTLLAFTNLSPDITKTFEHLVGQEAGHVKVIESKLLKLEG